MLIDLAARRPSGVGGKAESLAWLIAQQRRVPPGFVVPFDVVAALAAGGATEVRLREALAARIDPVRTYAVRSSANVEDGLTRSFAGQFASVLDVGGVDAIVAAIREVAASATSPSALAYAARGHTMSVGLRMAVIVQEMVTPVTSGVAFSKNPLTGLDEVVVEAIPGRGDALVQDGATPDRWVHRWGEMVDRPAVPRTDADLVGEVARETRRIARAYGRPADLEWVHDGQQVHWVQLRPLTGLEGVTVYSNRIAREVLPGLVKPLVWSINVPVVNRAWVKLFTEAIGPNAIDPNRLAKSIAYRAYFNMSTIGEIFVALGMPRESLELLLGLPSGADRPRFRPTAATMRHTPRMLRLMGRLNRYDRRLERELPEIEAGYRALAAEEVGALTEDELLRRVDGLARLTERAAYANIVAPLLMNLYGALVRRRSAAAGVDPARVDPAHGLPGIRDHDPRTSLAELAAAAAALDEETRVSLRAGGLAVLHARGDCAGLLVGVEAFLDRFGHLSDSGNDFSSARWREDPDLVVRMVLDAVPPTAGDPLGWSDLAPRVSVLERPILRRVFRRAGRFRQHREAVSFLYTYGYGLFRPTFLELGRRLVRAGLLDAPDDVFYLVLDELRGLVASREPAHALVAHRRSEMEEARDLDLPAIIVGDDFVPRRRRPTGARELRGVPSSRGTYRGPVRVIRSSGEFDRMRDGDVLVVPFSDVAWTPLFARAGAVVAESGGMLSHSSIVAREQGVPCVVSVPGACDLRDGAIVHVDGYGGVVSIEDGEEPVDSGMADGRG
jgi:phosphohistidine swiveling domain-containing protein